VWKNLHGTAASGPICKVWCRSKAKSHPQCSLEIEKARGMISMLEFTTSPLDDEEVDSIRNRLLMALHAEREDNRERMYKTASRASGTERLWLKIAATIMIIPLAAVGLYVLMKAPDATIAFADEPHPGLEQRINPAGQKSVLFLSDGSKVWLNAASNISYVKDFGEQDRRDVYLDGEAFFDVVANAEKPFVVHTSSIKIKVLGTSFNVKSYPEEKTIETR
jgi:transmembrane sensor